MCFTSPPEEANPSLPVARCMGASDVVTAAPASIGIGIYVDNWKINPISLLGGHGNRKIVFLAVLKVMV
jgi:hypothetical protein